MMWYKLAQTNLLNCSPSSILNLINNFDDINQLYMFDMGTEHDANRLQVQKLRGKKYKLNFILHAFNQMADALEDNYEKVEVDYDNLSRYDYDIREMYDDLFDSHAFKEYFQECLDERDLSDFFYNDIQEGYVRDIFTDDNYLASLSEIETYILNQPFIEDMIDGVGGITKGPSYLFHSITTHLGLGAAALDIEANKSKSLYTIIKELNGSSLALTIIKEIAKKETSKDPTTTVDDQLYTEEESVLIVKIFVRYLIDTYCHNFNQIHVPEELRDVIEKEFFDKVKECWWEGNKDSFHKDHEESLVENATYDYDQEDKKWAKEALPAALHIAPEQQRGQRHVVAEGFTKMLANNEWISKDENQKIMVDKDSYFSNIGLQEWNNISKKLKDMNSEFSMKGNEDYIEKIKEYVNLINFTLGSDEVLKDFFQEEKPLTDLGDLPINDMHSIILKFQDTAESMESLEGRKLIEEFNRMDRIKEYIEGMAVRAEKEEQEKEKRRIRKENFEKEKEASEKLKQQLKDPSISTRKFDDEQVKEVKQQNIIQKPFHHMSTLRIDQPYPGMPFLPKGKNDHLTSFHIAIHPKASQTDAPGIKEVFSRESGLNDFHGKGFPTHGTLDSDLLSTEYYDFLGWVGGQIDIVEKDLFVYEIQSDVVQNTTRMRNTAEAMAKLNEEKNKLDEEYKNILKKINIKDYNNFYNKKIDEIKAMIQARSEDKNFDIKKMELVIEKLENDKTNKVNPFEKEKQRMSAIETNIKNVNNQIINIEEYRKENERPSFPLRPHLSPFKSQIENKFKSWIDIFYNEIFMYCSRIQIKNLYIISSHQLQIIWKRYVETGTKELFEKVYDEQAKKHNMSIVQRGLEKWWHLDLTKSSPRFASNWYSKIKIAQNEDFKDIYIDDILRKFKNGEITQENMRTEIAERYLDAATSMNERSPGLFKIEIKEFFKHFFRIMKEENEGIEEPEEAAFIKIEKMKEAISNFMETTGRKYQNNDGELEQPFNSIFNKFLLQEYDYDVQDDSSI